MSLPSLIQVITFFDSVAGESLLIPALHVISEANALPLASALEDLLSTIVLLPCKLSSPLSEEFLYHIHVSTFEYY